MHTSWATVRETLRTHKVCTVGLPADGESVLRIRRASTPEPQHVELYEVLGVPTKIMTPEKTWSDGEAPGSDAKTALTLVLQHLAPPGAEVRSAMLCLTPEATSTTPRTPPARNDDLP